MSYSWISDHRLLLSIILIFEFCVVFILYIISHMKCSDIIVIHTIIKNYLVDCSCLYCHKFDYTYSLKYIYIFLHRINIFISAVQTLVVKSLRINIDINRIFELFDINISQPPNIIIRPSRIIHIFVTMFSKFLTFRLTLSLKS